MIDPGTPLNMCKLDGRIHARLWRAGITTIGALAARSYEELLDIDHFGPGRLTQIEEFLSRHGYQLAAEPAGEPEDTA